LAFLKPSRKTAFPQRTKLKKREALLLNSYNLRNVVNNSLSFAEVLTFYFGSIIECSDILMKRLRRRHFQNRCFPLPGSNSSRIARHQNFNARHKFDVYANVNIL